MVFNCSITRNDVNLSWRFSKHWKKLPFRISKYHVYVDSRNKKHRIVYIYDHDNRQQVCKLTLHPVIFNGILAYSVDSAYVSPMYQGNKIAFNLYKNLLVKYNINLLTVGSHSPGAKKLWNDLADDKLISAYGIKADGTKVWRCQADNNKKRIKSRGNNPSVYNGREGIGIFLTKANSKSANCLEKLIRYKSKTIDILKTKNYEFYTTLYA